MAITASSGTTAFAPSLGELIFDAFARCQIRSASLSNEHFFQARLSANILFSEWSNVGMPLLWKVDEILLPLQPGIGQYELASNIIAPMDGFIRQYQLGTGQNFAAVITGTTGDTTATIVQVAHSFAAGDLAYFSTAIAASGQVIQGAYLVTTVVDADTYQIPVPTPMDGTNTTALPVFTAVSGNSTVSIHLANHGLSIGKSFFCNVATTVGGIQLSGQLVVASVQDADHFTCNIGPSFGSSGSTTMNSGLAQVATQASGVDTTDFIMTQVSRSDYVSQADKGPNLIYRPTTFWFQRRITPILTLWNPPDDNSAYILHLWAMTQPFDAVVEGGVGVDIPYRYIAAFSAGLAAKLARKYPPPIPGAVGELQAEAMQALQDALREDVERVPLYLAGGMQSYWR